MRDLRRQARVALAGTRRRATGGRAASRWPRSGRCARARAAARQLAVDAEVVDGVAELVQRRLEPAHASARRCRARARRPRGRRVSWNACWSLPGRGKRSERASTASTSWPWSTNRRRAASSTSTPAIASCSGSSSGDGRLLEEAVLVVPRQQRLAVGQPEVRRGRRRRWRPSRAPRPGRGRGRARRAARTASPRRARRAPCSSRSGRGSPSARAASLRRCATSRRSGPVRSPMVRVASHVLRRSSPSRDVRRMLVDLVVGQLAAVDDAAMRRVARAQLDLERDDALGQLARALAAGRREPAAASPPGAPGAPARPPRPPPPPRAGTGRRAPARARPAPPRPRARAPPWPGWPGPTPPRTPRARGGRAARRPRR